MTVCREWRKARGRGHDDDDDDVRQQSCMVVDVVVVRRLPLQGTQIEEKGKCAADLVGSVGADPDTGQ